MVVLKMQVTVNSVTVVGATFLTSVLFRNLQLTSSYIQKRIRLLSEGSFMVMKAVMLSPQKMYNCSSITFESQVNGKLFNCCISTVLK